MNPPIALDPRDRRLLNVQIADAIERRTLAPDERLPATWPLASEISG